MKTKWNFAIVLILLLGMFMETLSMMVATVPIIAPIMFKAGYDPVWYGVLFVILIETAMINRAVNLREIFNLLPIRPRRKPPRWNMRSVIRRVSRI